MKADNVWKATRRGDLEKVRHFIAHDGVPDVRDDYDQQSLLTVACEAGHLEIVRLVWENQEVRRPQYAPEAFVAMRCGHLEVLRLLLELGVDAWGAGEFSRHGPSLLDEAVKERNVAVVRLLLEFDFDVEGWITNDLEAQITREEDEIRVTPPIIELAARAGDEELVEFLLQFGARLEGDPELYREKAQQNEEEFRRNQERFQKWQEIREQSQRSTLATDAYQTACGCGLIVLFVLCLPVVASIEAIQAFVSRLKSPVPPEED